MVEKYWKMKKIQFGQGCVQFWLGHGHLGIFHCESSNIPLKTEIICLRRFSSLSVRGVERGWASGVSDPRLTADSYQIQ